MGYTHYFTQKRSLTKAEWSTVCDDVRAILTYSQHECGIALGDGMGEPGTSPTINAHAIAFNGIGDDSHETFRITRLKNTKPDYPGQEKSHYASDFTKTERKPYDDAVTACLCYLTTVTRREDPVSHAPILGTEAWISGSDGHGKDFLVGLDLARKALPKYGNVLDIPMDIMKQDRWCAPWVNTSNLKTYGVHFCIDGKGYVIRVKTGESYCFESHMALAQFLEKTKRVDTGSSHFVSWGGMRRENYRIEPDIWDATGSFDKARHARIAKAQQRVLVELFPVDPACAQQPPAYVRPGQMPDNAGRAFCYSISDLLNLAQ